MLYSILNAHFWDIRVEPVSAEMVESSINNAKPSNHSKAMDTSVFLINASFLTHKKTARKPIFVQPNIAE